MHTATLHSMLTKHLFIIFCFYFIRRYLHCNPPKGETHEASTYGKKIAVYWVYNHLIHGDTRRPFIHQATTESGGPWRFITWNVKLWIGFYAREKSDAWFLSVHHVDPDKCDTPASFIPFTRLHSNANRIEFCKSRQQAVHVVGARRDTGKRLTYDKMCILVYIYVTCGVTSLSTAEDQTRGSTRLIPRIEIGQRGFVCFLWRTSGTNAIPVAEQAPTEERNRR